MSFCLPALQRYPHPSAPSHFSSLFFGQLVHATKCDALACRPLLRPSVPPSFPFPTLTLPTAPPVDPVQYVVVRADLAAPPHGWPAGALMAQAVHAALAAAVAYADHPVTAAYTAQRGGAHLPGSLAPPSPPPSPPSSATSLAGGDPDAADTAAAPQMHTVVLAAKGEAALEGLAAKLEAAALDFVLWREQPEGVATALATRVRLVGGGAGVVGLFIDGAGGGRRGIRGCCRAACVCGKGERPRSCGSLRRDFPGKVLTAGGI